MTYRIVQIVDTYDRRGNIARSDKSEVFSSDDVLETVRYRYSKSATGYLISLTDNECVRLVTERVDGSVIDFSEIYRIVEGDAAYHAVLNGDAEPVSEEVWIVSKSKA